jgi:hypothetical protein
MVDAFGIPGNFLADHPGCVGIVLGAAHAPDSAIIDDVDVQRTSGRAIMRADGSGSAKSNGLVHGASLPEPIKALKRIAVMRSIRRIHGRAEAPPRVR